ncbi:General substrate transporter [Kalmanozyma brasiliensis GHG001]|uniref:Putative maltose permease (MalP) n=1 Tax=Kalmanozyma brasiliensis (strain GHG001) TaxID=1365824 RepID=V5GFR9_KALBG|nr:General substrate transporter [Kalmanozyma brasiliensis GHG001]EST04872.1 General substrate transporter [Kalmanozyma brasiliensis GHG001]
MLVDNNNVARIDHDTREKLIEKFGDRFDEVVERSARSTKWQTASSLRESFRQWPKSVVWSVLFSLAIVQIGYDSSILSSFFAQPAFTQKFGECTLADDGTQNCQISAPWQQGLTNGAWIGSIIGLQLAGSVAERIGHLRLMMISTTLMLSFVFIPFFATSLPIFLVGQILMGIPWGGFQSLASAYASEICPVSLRPLLTTYVNLCWVFGQLLAAGVLRATVVRSDVWAWKIPYALQFFWPFPVFITCCFAPESPWWLTRHGKDEQAFKSIDRLLSKDGISQADSDELVKDYQAMIQYTEAMEAINERESSLQKNNRYIDCFKGVDRRRTEIACWAWLIQITSGAPLQGFSTYFFSQAGLSTINAFNMSMAMYALGAVGTILSWFLVNRVGRRQMYLWGQSVMFSTMLVTGCLGFAKQTTAVSWAIGAMLLLCTFVYDLTVGPICFAIIAEVSSTRLRSKTIVLACNTYNLALIVANILQPQMLNSNTWNLGPKTAFLWAVTGAFSLVWTYFRLPELANRTYGELEVLFAAKVPARKFATTTIDQFQTIEHEVQSADMEKSSVSEKGEAVDGVEVAALSK